MSNMVRVAVDAMGGDNAPKEVIYGAVKAVSESSRIHVTLVGRQEDMEEVLKGMDYPKDRISLRYASEVIETAEPPVRAIRRKKDSSLVCCMKMVHDQEADAMVSSGSSGAILVGGQLLVGRIPGVDRAPLAPLIPTEHGPALLIDCGANVDARPDHLLQFARMGSVYMESVIGRKNPRVAILNIGAEEEKGNKLVKETFPLLKACDSIHFTGSIEAREIPHGGADVIVCEAFAGNIVLKLYEGVATTLLSKMKEGLMSTARAKIGGLLIKPALKEALREFDVSRYGGAPLLGLNGLVVKAHGSADRTEIANAILQCVTFSEQEIGQKIRKELSSEE